MTFLETIDREGRFGEWVTSAALLTVALTMALPGDSMVQPTWAVLAGYGATEAMVIVVLLPLACLRLGVLWINGHWHRSPQMRGIGASLGLGLWAALALASALPALTGRAPADCTSGLYLIFALADLRGAYRAGMDDRHDAPRLAD